MEFICHCAAKAWRLRLMAHDLVSAKWLPGMFEISVQSLPEAQHVSPDLWLFEDSRREFATDTDPVIEVHLRDDGVNAEARVTLDGLETRLDNRVPARFDSCSW